MLEDELGGLGATIKWWSTTRRQQQVYSSIRDSKSEVDLKGKDK